MSHNKNHDSQQLPVGRLGIISPYSCAELGTKVDNPGQLEKKTPQ